MLIAFDGREPRVDPQAYVHESAHVIGEVVIGPESSVWFGTVVRGDINAVVIGARTNLQDNVTVHVTKERWPTRIGDDVTVGHGAILHGCTIADRCLIGIGAIVLDGAKISSDCLVAAGSLVAPGLEVPSGHMVMGHPAKVTRPLREAELAHLLQSAAGYVDRSRRYRAQGIF